MITKTQKETLEFFKSYAVTDVRSVAEFLDRYYRPDRYRECGEKYAAVVLKSHEADFKEHGMDWLCEHESITGRVVAFYGNSEACQ
ncbi:MAG: hypothetical protein U9Q37_04785 [Euryarchaeota archaeon]|nr:hypothetical protein [Euryarchaeota archaeon]